MLKRARTVKLLVLATLAGSALAAPAARADAVRCGESDFGTADRLCFEVLSYENVVNGIRVYMDEYDWFPTSDGLTKSLTNVYVRIWALGPEGRYKFFDRTGMTLKPPTNKWWWPKPKPTKTSFCDHGYQTSWSKAMLTWKDPCYVWPATTTDGSDSLPVWRAGMEVWVGDEHWDLRGTDYRGRSKTIDVYGPWVPGPIPF